MRKAWKIAALLIGLPVILTGWLALDSYSRAVSAIAAHDSRLRSEIAALRSKQVPSPLLQGRDLSSQELRKIPCPLSAYLERSTYTLETAHTKHQRIYYRCALYSFEDGFGRPRSECLSEDHLILAVAITDAAFPEGGFNAYSIRTSFEYRALEELRHSLARANFNASALQRIAAALDQVLRRRPSISEILMGEHLLDQLQTLSVLHTRSDPLGWIRRTPGWKEFFSWRILIAKSLNQLEDEYLDLCKLPFELYPDHGSRSQPSGNALTSSELEREAFALVEDEKRMLCHWHIARTATALKRFRMDKSRECTDLYELIPEYLAEVPVNPRDGEVILYQDGYLKSGPIYGNDTGIDWNLKPE